jgi:sterol desaturase/sphingolipid hydroxylase (fatty acid hydroxylase superfamily)
MMAGWIPAWGHWALIEVPLFTLVILSTHLVVSGGQTVMHRWLGHRRIGGALFRNHINFHHTLYARGHLAAARDHVATAEEANDGNNTPFFLIPIALVAGVLFFVLPLGLFIAVMLAAGASFYAHVHLDKAYHVEGSYLERFAWFRRKRQLHFVHHLHANANYAVIDFFWDRVLGTFRKADR